MEDILGAIEALPPAVALRQSFIAYPLVSALHILGVGGLVTSVLVMHWRRFRSRYAADGGTDERLLRPVALVAFLAAVASGIALFSIRAGDYADNPAFRIKLLLIGAAVANLALHQAIRRSGGTAAGTTLASACLWTGALVAGRFIGFVE